MKEKLKILFILKKKEPYHDEYGENDGKEDGGYGMETGLLNSATFVNDMLNAHGIHSDLVVVHDNNDIDREVTKHRPNIVIIEALWVVPEKFEILQKLHPKVKWIVRLHSAIPFVANEGIAIKWIFGYLKHKNVSVSCNDSRILEQLKFLTQIKFNWVDEMLDKKLLFQPNYYPPIFKSKRLDLCNPVWNIGCFGAIRPMKNQLQQAIAAIEFAAFNGKKLNFHINGNRIEMKGSPVLNNIQDLFKEMEPLGYKLIEHDWTDHEEFVKLCSKMDLGLQVSFTETFNIVAADFVSVGVPIVTSDEVSWATSTAYADPNDPTSIVKKLTRISRNPKFNVWMNQRNLKAFDKKSVIVWVEGLEKLIY